MHKSPDITKKIAIQSGLTRVSVDETKVNGHGTVQQWKANTPVLKIQCLSILNV